MGFSMEGTIYKLGAGLGVLLPGCIRGFARFDLSETEGPNCTPRLPGLPIPSWLHVPGRTTAGEWSHEEGVEPACLVVPS